MVLITTFLFDLILHERETLNFSGFFFHFSNQSNAVTIASSWWPIYADNLTKKLGHDVRGTFTKQCFKFFLSNGTFQRWGLKSLKPASAKWITTSGVQQTAELWLKSRLVHRCGCSHIMCNRKLGQTDQSCNQVLRKFPLKKNPEKLRQCFFPLSCGRACLPTLPTGN